MVWRRVVFCCEAIIGAECFCPVVLSSGHVAEQVPEFCRQPAVDRREAGGDHRHAGEMLHFQLFAEKHRTEQDGADGDEEGDEGEVGGAGAGKNAEEDQIGQCRRQKGDADKRAPSAEARHGEHPWLVDDERRGDQH